LIKQIFSKHHLENRRYIDIKSLVNTLNVLKLLRYESSYDVSNTICKSNTPINQNVINYYKTKGVCKYPIIVTDDDFCLDGRHRVIYRKQINDTICPAYIVPKEYVNKFIVSY
jgi:hypothetical protein